MSNTKTPALDGIVEEIHRMADKEWADYGCDFTVTITAAEYRDLCEEENRNENLVDAASELYEALKALRQEMIDSGNYDAEDYNWPTVAKITDAALAKARGE